MLRTIALIGLAAAFALPSASAFAISGNSSAYGTEGYGPTVPTQSLTPFQRSWNRANESKMRARAGAGWLRHHGGYGPSLPPSQSVSLTGAAFPARAILGGNDGRGQAVARSRIFGRAAVF